MTNKTSDPQPEPTDIEEAAPARLTTFEGLGLHDQTIAALEAMAYEGLSLHLAATKNNIRPDNFTRSFNKPEVRRVYNQIVKDIRENAAAQAYVRNVNLAQSSNSDHVKADLNKWIAGVDGISMVKKVDGQIQHNIQFGGFDYGDEPPIDVTPEDTQSPADDE